MSDYLSEEEQVAALKKWWDENGKTLVVGVVVAVVAIFGWRGFQDYQQEQAESAAALYAAYQEQRAAEVQDRDELARLAEALEQDYPRSGYRTFVLFYQAADAVAAEDYELAREHLGAAADSASDPRLRNMASIRLARTLQQLGEPDAALAALGNVRGEGFFAEVAELKGDILMAQGDRGGALEAYEAARNTTGGARSPLLEMKLLDLAETSDAAVAAADGPSEPAGTVGDEATTPDSPEPEASAAEPADTLPESSDGVADAAVE